MVNDCLLCSGFGMVYDCFICSGLELGGACMGIIKGGIPGMFRCGGIPGGT
jgi:hypothetical protein